MSLVPIEVAVDVAESVNQFSLVVCDDIISYDAQIDTNIEVAVDVAENVNQFSLIVCDDIISYDARLDTNIVVDGQPYEDDYIVTPSEETRVLQTSGRQVVNDITINPIPDNYGLITWDGTKLTVS